MKPTIVKAYLELVNPNLPENHPVKYRNNKLELNNLPNIKITDIVFSWHSNFNRCLKDELKDYKFSQIYLKYSNGMAINYEWNEAKNKIDRSFILSQNVNLDPIRSANVMKMDMKELYKKVNQLFKF
ncbi:hypothetical protein [Aeromonas hydrophila]